MERSEEPPGAKPALQTCLSSLRLRLIGRRSVERGAEEGESADGTAGSDGCHQHQPDDRDGLSSAVG